MSLLFAIDAVLVAIQFFKGGKVLINEAGHEAEITHPQIGYWLWLTSMCIMLIAASLPVTHWLKTKWFTRTNN